MLKCRGVYKNPNGKLVIIDTVLYNDKIVDLVISGDFFAHPEEAVEELENSLKGLMISDAERVLVEKASSIVLVGLEIKDLIKALNEMKCSEERVS